MMVKKIKKNVTLDNLAGMVKRGFDGVDKRLDENLKEHRTIVAKLDNLENGVEEIKLKLDQVAYRFEVQELDRRLKRVEAKLGFK